MVTHPDWCFSNELWLNTPDTNMANRPDPQRVPCRITFTIPASMETGCPYFSVYDLSKFVAIHGSVKATREAIEGFRERVRAAGFPDLHFNAVVWGKPVLPGEVVIEEMIEEVAEIEEGMTEIVVNL